MAPERQVVFSSGSGCPATFAAFPPLPGRTAVDVSSFLRSQTIDLEDALQLHFEMDLRVAVSRVAAVFGRDDAIFMDVSVSQ